MIIALHEKQALGELLKRSHHEPVLLFKHSTQCSRSAGVIEDRDISDEIEDRFGIRHESPQAILIVNEKPTWHASHWKITEDAIEAAFLQNLSPRGEGGPTASRLEDRVRGSKLPS